MYWFCNIITTKSDNVLLKQSVSFAKEVSDLGRPYKFPPDKTTCVSTPSLLRQKGRLGSGPRLVGRIGSGMWVTVSFPRLILFASSKNWVYDLGGFIGGVLTLIS